jgi:hypothetical protein
MENLTFKQMQIIEREIISVKDYKFPWKLKWIARNAGVSQATACRARHLLKFYPDVWDSCLTGERTIHAGWRASKFVCDI